eukprot:8698324-Pyramimonas_sp.AAC.1
MYFRCAFIDWVGALTIAAHGQVIVLTHTSWAKALCSPPERVRDCVGTRVKEVPNLRSCRSIGHTSNYKDAERAQVPARVRRKFRESQAKHHGRRQPSAEESRLLP